MKLVLLGQPRTGTMSTWAFFKNHPEVSISIPKEYLRIYEDDLSGYVEKAHFVNRNVKVLLDGSPGIFYNYGRFYEILESLRSQGISDIVQIYNVRDPIKQLISMIDRKFWSCRRGASDFPNYITDDFKIKEKELHQICEFMLNESVYLRHVEKELGRDNIFFVHLSEFEKRQRDIFEFLGIESDVLYKFPVTNTCCELGYDIQQLRLKNDVMKFIDNNMNSFGPIIEENQRMRKERYGI